MRCTEAGHERELLAEWEAKMEQVDAHFTGKPPGDDGSD